MRRAVLDACVLYPTLVRALLLRAAAEGHFAPLWSARILEEWRRAVKRKLPEQSGLVTGEIAAIRAAYPGAEIAADPDLEARLSLPDADDRHVLATAIAGGAGEIVTFNLNDFPGRTLAREGIVARHPDGYLLEIMGDAPDFAGHVAACVAQMPVDAAPRAILKRAKLPRLGKALAAG